MPKLDDELPVLRNPSHRHYWLREDFDHLIGLIPGIGIPSPRGRDSSASLDYPKSTEGAMLELRLRGLDCDGELLTKLVEKGIVNPGRGHAMMTNDKDEVVFGPSDRILYWDKEHIDTAAEWLYSNEHWKPWTHFCWVANLRFGQAVKAHRVACARYGLGFHTSFDIPGYLTIIEPAQNALDNYATIRFYPDSMKAEVTKV